MSRGYSCDSLSDSNNLFHLQIYHLELKSILAYKNSQNDIYNKY